MKKYIFFSGTLIRGGAARVISVLAAALAAVLLAPADAPAAPGANAKSAAKAKPAAATAAGALRAKPVRVEIDAPLPKGLPRDLNLGGSTTVIAGDGDSSGGGYAVTYLVRGKGIVGVDADSLRVSSAVAGGADVSKNDRGRDSWKAGPFPSVAEDGSAATFEVRLAPGASRVKNAVPVVHGTIGIECATGRETKTATISTNPGSTARLGPLSLKVPAAEEDGEADGGGEADMAAALSAAMEQAGGADGGDAEAAAAFIGMFGGGGGSDGFDLEVSGDESGLARIVLVVDGKEVEHRSWMNFGRGSTFGFPAVEGDSVRVKAEFWTGRRTETVSF